MKEFTYSKRSAGLVGMLFLFLILSATAVQAQVPPEPATITITPQSATLDPNAGGFVQFTAEVLDANGNPIDTVVIWSSSDTSVAIIDETGIANPIGFGTATITAQSGGISATALVLIPPPVISQILIFPETASLDPGMTQQFLAEPQDANGFPMEGPVTWSSSDQTIATVDGNGLVTAVSPGSASITAQSGEVTNSALVTVIAPTIATLQVSPSTITITSGNFAPLFAQAFDGNGISFDAPVTWSSSDETVATVSPDGIVFAISQGSAAITAQSESASVSAVVTVIPPILATLDIAPTSATLDVGQTVQILTDLLNDNGGTFSGALITWTSSDNAIALVDANGLVAAEGPGIATITVTASSGEVTLTKTAIVTVNAPPVPPDPIPLSFADSVTLNKNSFIPGEGLILTATIQATQNVPDGLIDVEIYNSAGIQVIQRFAPVSFAANQDLVQVWNIPAPAQGNYTVKLGIFSGNWATLYKWNNGGNSFVVNSSNEPPPPGVFSSSAVSDSPNYGPGSPALITTTVIPDQNISNAVIDTEIYDSQGSKVGQNFVVANLVAGQTASFNWNFSAPQNSGQYTVKVGVFTANWASLYSWNNSAGGFSVGGQPPPPGNSELIILAPADGGNVSGIVEIKAIMNNMPLNSYSIGWRTDPNGGFTAMPADATNSFKSNFIDFTSWNWRTDNTYPLEFRAADLSGIVLGTKLIHVLHP